MNDQLLIALVAYKLYPESSFLKQVFLTMTPPTMKVRSKPKAINTHMYHGRSSSCPYSGKVSISFSTTGVVLLLKLGVVELSTMGMVLLSASGVVLLSASGVVLLSETGLVLLSATGLVLLSATVVVLLSATVVVLLSAIGVVLLSAT